jgi:hypothetical protein
LRIFFYTKPVNKGTWVAIEDPLVGDAAGQGMSMVNEGEDPASWSPISEGFGVGVMHQLHCVVSTLSVFYKKASQKLMFLVHLP